VQGVDSDALEALRVGKNQFVTVGPDLSLHSSLYIANSWLVSLVPSCLVNIVCLFSFMVCCSDLFCLLCSRISFSNPTYYVFFNFVPFHFVSISRSTFLIQFCAYNHLKSLYLQWPLLHLLIVIVSVLHHIPSVTLYFLGSCIVSFLVLRGFYT